MQQFRIIVGVDGSHSSIAALRFAAQLARPLGASIEAVTTWEFPLSVMYPVGEWSPQKDAERVLASALEDAFGNERPLQLMSSVVQGGAARALIETSANADMLVVGSRGHGGFAGLVLGSVSAACAAHGKCPVLVVHGERPE